MKKFAVGLAVFAVIIIILSLGFYILVKTQLSTENINNKIMEIAAKSGYEVKFDNSQYKIGLFTLSAELGNISIRSKEFFLTCKKVSIILNPFLALQKKFELSNLLLDTPILTIYKTESSDTVSSEKKDSGILLTTTLKIINGEVKYDTLSINSVNGLMFVNIDKKIAFTGNLTLKSDIKYLKDFNLMTVSLTGAYETGLELEKTVLSTKYFTANAKVKETDGEYSYSIFGTIDSTNYLINKFASIDSFDFKGGFDYFVKGIYHSKSPMDSQYESLIDSFQLDPKSVQVNFKSYNLLLEDLSFINKQGNHFVVSSNWIIDSLPIEFIFIADYKMLFNDTLKAKITSKGIPISKITDNISGLEYTIDGRIASNSEISISLSNILNLDSLISSGKHRVTCGEAYIIKDSIIAEIKSFEIKAEFNKIIGSMSLNGRGIDGNIFFKGDYAKKEIVATTLSKLDLNYYKKSMTGKGEINANLKYNYGNNEYTVNASGSVGNFTEKNLNDTIDISFDGLEIENGKNMKLSSLVFAGNNIDGTAKNLIFNKGEKEDIISGNVDFAFFNYDSIFVPKKPKENETVKSEPPKIDKRYKGEIKGFFDRMIFKSEDIRNGELVIKIANGDIFAYPIKADIMKGKINGNVEYYSEKNGLIHSKIESKKVDINEFLTKNKFVPFTIGAKVDLKSDLTFLQHKVKETVKGDIIVEAKDGWLLMPEIISNISKVLKLPLSDTFFFDDMYGDFNVDSQRVKFDDFTMEKNGHSLDYSGRVDFNKNMNLKGKYVIDMRIADTGLLEKILRMANYESDSIIVDFDVLGTYSKPRVAITYNSVGEYLKNQTNDAVNDLIEEMNNLFKF
jgi:hypothetical protein